MKLEENQLEMGLDYITSINERLNSIERLLYTNLGISNKELVLNQVPVEVDLSNMKPISAFRYFPTRTMRSKLEAKIRESQKTGISESSKNA